MRKTLLSLAAMLSFAAAFAGDGSAASPYTVDDLIQKFTEDAGFTADGVYLQGYIVGAIPSGSGMSLANTVFGTEGVANSNIVLAGTSAEDDYNMCVAIQLPSNAVRTALNLPAHPENLGHEVKLLGQAVKYFGGPGMKETSSYEWIGDAPVFQEPDVVGTKDAPVSVTEYLTLPSNSGKAWVKGVIVGYVPGQKLEEAVFNAEGENVSASNILIAAEPTTDVTKCVPVQLVSKTDPRAVLNLKDNPENLGKTVTLFGVREQYFGAVGLKNVTECTIDGETPVVPDDGTIYSALKEGDATCDWTIDNGTLPEGLTYVWSWKEYSGKHYMNASAFINNTAYATDAVTYSPVIDLTAKSGTITMSFDHAAKFQNGNVKEEFRVMAREEGGEWADLQIPVMPTAGTWTFVNSGDIDLSSYAGKKIQVGLRYVSTDAAADTWEVKNLKVMGEPESAVEGVAVEEGPATWFDLQGRRVANPANGLYIRVQGNKATKVIVK